MKYYQIVFSPTGGTERVAKAITQNWPQVDTIDLSAPDTKYADICLESDALAVIAMPSFIGVAPQLALNRLAMIKGNGVKCVIVAVYGNRAYEDTLVQMEDYAQPNWIGMSNLYTVFIQIPIEISPVLRNLITVIFYY